MVEGVCSSTSSSVCVHSIRIGSNQASKLIGIALLRSCTGTPHEFKLVETLLNWPRLAAAGALAAIMHVWGCHRSRPRRASGHALPRKAHGGRANEHRHVPCVRQMCEDGKGSMQVPKSKNPGGLRGFKICSISAVGSEPSSSASHHRTIRATSNTVVISHAACSAGRPVQCTSRSNFAAMAQASVLGGHRVAAPQPTIGSISLIVGPMFSGKTSELLKRVGRSSPLPATIAPFDAQNFKNLYPLLHPRPHASEAPHTHRKMVLPGSEACGSQAALPSAQVQEGYAVLAG